MSTRLFLLILCLATAVHAYPPAPFHRIYGSVRDEQGNPLATGVGTIILSGTAGAEIIRSTSDTGLGVGINYSLSVPMDSGTTTQLYTVSSLRPLLPFTIRVVINNVSYVPMQMVGATWNIGAPSASTRLDLTLGVDSDGDGLPDQWENNLIDGDLSGLLTSLADVDPNGDLDNDGSTNLDEYIAGTYALDPNDKFSLRIISVNEEVAHLQFLGITGRTYGIKSSTTLGSSNQQAFSTEPSGENPTLYYRSDDVRIINAYVPVDEQGKAFFTLETQQ